MQRLPQDQTSVFAQIFAQARGDLAWDTEAVGFPSWASGQICWLCKVNKSDKRCNDFKSSGRSRSNAAAFFNKQRSNGILPSPRFQCPGFALGMVVIDALHCFDLGVSQQIMGNILREALDMCPAARVVGRLSLRWAHPLYLVRRSSTAEAPPRAHPGNDSALQQKTIFEDDGIIPFCRADRQRALRCPEDRVRPYCLGERWQPA